MQSSSLNSLLCLQMCRTNCSPRQSWCSSSGRKLGRPRADTLNGSRHANTKELRFDAADGVWRVAFAFDPNRKAVLLACGDKSGGSKKRFYRQLIEKADSRFDSHLVWVRQEKQKQKNGGKKK